MPRLLLHFSLLVIIVVILFSNVPQWRILITKAQAVVAELHNQNPVREIFTNSSKLLLHLTKRYFELRNGDVILILQEILLYKWEFMKFLLKWCLT